MSGAIVCKAATRYVRKSVGSLSPSSSDNQATCWSHPATHALTSMVFPKPAGAAMRVSLRCSPSFNRSNRRGRLTTSGRSGGIYSFVAKIGVGMSHPPYFLSPPTTFQIGFSMVQRCSTLGRRVLLLERAGKTNSSACPCHLLCKALASISFSFLQGFAFGLSPLSVYHFGLRKKTTAANFLC